MLYGANRSFFSWCVCLAFLLKFSGSDFYSSVSLSEDYKLGIASSIDESNTLGTDKLNQKSITTDPLRILVASGNLITLSQNIAGYGDANSLLSGMQRRDMGRARGKRT